MFVMTERNRQFALCSCTVCTIRITLHVTLPVSVRGLRIMQCQRVYSAHKDLDDVTARISSCWNYGATNVAPPQKDRPLPSSKWRPHFSNTYLREQNLDQKSRRSFSSMPVFWVTLHRLRSSLWVPEKRKLIETPEQLLLLFLGCNFEPSKKYNEYLNA
jgi:hypothetical protein